MGYPFNNITFGKDNEFVNTVIEIPKGSMNKIEWQRHEKYFILDRVEPGIFSKPTNYGFIPQTLDEDGDELDTLIITDEPLITGLVVEARVIGALDFEDDGENDHKIIVVPVEDRHLGKITSLDQLPEQVKKQIEHHFSHYKDLKSGGTIVRGFLNIEDSWKIIRECSERAIENKWW